MDNVIKQLAVLGSTGSVGQQTLDVIRRFPHHFRIIGLAAASHADLLARQIEEFQPRYVYLQNRAAHLSDGGYKFLSMEDIACHPEVDTVVIATSGKSGLLPTIAAVTSGKNIALANKESLVMAGEIITTEARLSGAQILPVDSEHSAIWQCLNGETLPPARLILTASGGPFLHYPSAQLSEVTARQALKHPSWHMGRKITIDSATLMNKGLEVIEAHWLFNVPFEDITAVVHPQSIIHSLVEFSDGSAKAQLGYPDMCLPIQYALSYPQRLSNPQLPRLNWDNINQLTFEPLDTARFPCFQLAVEAGKKGGTYPAVLCAADEVAVTLFLSQRLRFTDIAPLIEWVLEQHQAVAHPTLNEIMAADAWARDKATQFGTGNKL